jgi:hypothetical protein
MLEESAMKAIGDMLVRKKNKGNNDEDTEQPTRKRRRHNEACNTTRGATIVGAMRGTCRRDLQETAAFKKKQVSSLNAEKKSMQILLTLIRKRKEQCDEAINSRWLQRQSTEPLPSLGGEAMESVTVSEQVIVDEYWQVHENSVKDVMDIFLRLFVPESKVLSKNKPIKWSVLNEKALPVTKEHFDSKVEAAIQRSLQVETQLAELQTEDTPAGVFEDADNDTSEDENQIQTSLKDETKKY